MSPKEFKARKGDFATASRILSRELNMLPGVDEAVVDDAEYLRNRKAPDFGSVYWVAKIYPVDRFHYTLEEADVNNGPVERALAGFNRADPELGEMAEDMYQAFNVVLDHLPSVTEFIDGSHNYMEAGIMQDDDGSYAIYMFPEIGNYHYGE